MKEYFYWTHVYLGSDLWVRVSETIPFWNLTDVTLADEDTNTLLTDDAKAMWQYASNTALLPTLEPSNASDVTWWPNFEPVYNKWENTYSKEIQIWLQEILQIRSWEIWEHLSQDLTVRQSRPGQLCPDFDFFLKRLDVFVQAHPWLQVQVHDHHHHHHLTEWPLYHQAERGGLCSHQGGHVLNLPQPNASGAIRWPNLELMQMAPSGD